MLRDSANSAGLEVAVDASGYGLEVNQEGLQVADHYAGRGIEPVYGGNDLEFAPQSKERDLGAHYIPLEAAQTPGEAVKWGEPRRRSRRGWYLLGAILLLLVILVAVLGGLLGSRARSTSSSSSPSTAPPGNSTALPGNSTTPPGKNSTGLLNNTAIAAVAWGTPDAVNHYRVYYQDEALQIRESSWDSVTTTWHVSNTGIGVARNGTPLAAAVNSSWAGMTSINLYSIDIAGQANEWVTTDGLNWKNGSLSTQRIFPANNSNLAATWTANNGGHLCRTDCPPWSVLLAYQNKKSQFQLGNSTSDTWAFSNVPINAIPGSGVSLSSLGQWPNPSQLRLFYQISSGNLVAADWVSDIQISSQNIVGKSCGWNLHENTLLATFDTRAPITSFVFGGPNGMVESYGSQSDFPGIVDALTSGSTGVTEVFWRPNGTSTYLPATKPSVMNAVQNFTSVASHAWGSLYALQGGNLMEFTMLPGNDTWLAKGPVVTS